MKEEQEIKYKKHNEAQIERILSTASRLFIEKGIDKTSFSDIASACRMMRSTLYKYYKNKEEILWNLQYQNMQTLGKYLAKYQTEKDLTTYRRFEIFLSVLYETFKNYPETFLFFDIFNSTYQEESTSSGNSPYKQMFHRGDFGSKDTMHFLMENFHDGSVRSDLQPEETAVSIIYGALGILTELSKNKLWMLKKYGLDVDSLVRLCFDLLLAGLNP